MFGIVLIAPGANGQDAGWQQRVHYSMDVRLVPEMHRLMGTQRLTYYNASPDTLYTVFYHLYFNAFKPTSMMAERNRDLPDPDRRVMPRITQLTPEQEGHQEVVQLLHNGKPVPFRVNDTVMRVDLVDPIMPSDSAVFDMVFEAQVPPQTRRTGRDNAEGVDYSMSQWYPKMAAYDAEGWHAHPYIGREFYAPYGTFDVTLHLPARYVVGATGVLQNPDETGHGYSEATPTGDTLSWHFVADQVHDFAWVADPDYQHDRIQDSTGVTYHLLYLPEVAAQWESLKEGLPAIMNLYSEQFGPYRYPQFTVAQAGDGGMEYPMMIFILGRRPPAGLMSLVAHEAGHQWFYAMVGTNESEHAWMDEGLTDYATDMAVDRLEIRPIQPHFSALSTILSAQEYGFFEPLETHSDWFETNTGYGVAAYSGGEALMHMLGYVMTDSLRDAFLKEYVRRYTFRHPGPTEMQRVAEEVSGLELDWFFRQMTETTSRIDYAVNGIRSRKQPAGWEVEVRLERKGDFVMPVDLALVREDGSAVGVHIPTSEMQGARQVPETWLVGAPWPWTQRHYVFTTVMPFRVKDVVIDPAFRTTDANRLDNYLRFPLRTRFLQPSRPLLDRYDVGWRPLVAGSRYYGPAVGVRAEGTYLFGKLQTHAMASLYPGVLWGDATTRSYLDGSEKAVKRGDAFDFLARVRHPLGRNNTLDAVSERHLGIWESRLSLEHQFGDFFGRQRTVRALTASVRYRRSSSTAGYLPDGLLALEPVSAVTARLQFDVGRPGTKLRAYGELGGSGGGFNEWTGRPNDATALAAEGVLTRPLGPFVVESAARFSYTPTGGFFSKSPRSGTVNSEEAWRNPAFRSIAALFGEGHGGAHFLPMAEAGTVSGSDVMNLPGNLVAAILVRAGIRPLGAFAMFAPLETSVYGAASTLRSYGPGITERVAETGLGLRYPVSSIRLLERWTAQSDVLESLKLEARFPLLVTGKKESLEQGFAWRYFFGITVGLP